MEAHQAEPAPCPPPGHVAGAAPGSTFKCPESLSPAIPADRTQPWGGAGDRGVVWIPREQGWGLHCWLRLTCLLPSAQPDSKPTPRPGRPGHRRGSERKPRPHVPSVSPWRAQLACPPRAAGPHSNQGRQEAKSGSGSPPPARPQQVVPGSLLCFLGPIHAEASGGRWALCHTLHAGAPPLAGVHADPLGPAWGRAAGALPTVARSSQDLLALPWATWSCVCVYAQPAVELHPGRRCQGPGTSTTAQHEPDQPRVSGASEGMGGAESVTLLPTGSPALSTQPPRL